jgi:hypothetical protein
MTRPLWTIGAEIADRVTSLSSSPRISSDLSPKFSLTSEAVRVLMTSESEPRYEMSTCFAATLSA